MTIEASLQARDKYLVVGIDGEWWSIRRFSGSQLRSSLYCIKLQDARRYAKSLVPISDDESSDSDTETFVVPRACDMPPQVPQDLDELSNPPHAEEVYDSKDA